MEHSLRFCRVAWFLLLAAMTAIQPALAQDEPTIAKASIQVTAWTFNEYKKNDKIYSWVPKIGFRVNGPITQGSQLYVEFKLPTGPWVSFDCKTGAVDAGYWWEVEDCGGINLPVAKGVTYTGPVNFTIGLRNEVTDTNATLFTGKMKVGKTLPRARKGPTEWVYYVDHDWNLPIGYLELEKDDIYGERLTHFHARLWVRGDVTRFEPHILYKGKEVGKVFLDNTPMGRASCSATIENDPTHYVDPALAPQKAKWARLKCSFPNVVGSDTSGQTRSPFPGQKGEIHVLSQNPGDYELKMVEDGELVRSIKFAVGEDGSIDNGIASQNQLGEDWVIVPVKVLGTRDGNWNKLAWKTDAFYGNPLKGFAAPP